MRIGFFSDAYLPEVSGVGVSLSWLKKALEDLGHEVIVYAPRYAGAGEDESDIYRFRARRFVFHKASRVALPYQHEAIRTFGTLDIAHSHTPFSLGFVALGASLRHHLPHVHSYHTHLMEFRHYLPPLVRPPKRAVKEFAAAFCNRCTVVTAHSTPIKEELLRYGVRRPILVLPFGIDLELFCRAPVWAPREALGVPASAPLCLYAGRLAGEKNLSFLLRAFAHLHRELPTARLVLAGDGPERGHLERQVAEDRLDSAVTFAGFLDHPHLIDLYKASDLFLFASKTETQGLVLVEAMASGLPTVAIGEMGTLDMIQDGENGLLAPEDERVFARVALSLLGDRDRHARLRQGALDAGERLSSLNTARRFVEIYQGALRGRGQEAGTPIV
jgi:glycosyltransferase involved in cell wall biosynthesis